MAVKTRYSAREIQVRNAAEEEILRYRDSTFLWAKHILNVTLDPHQMVFVSHFDQHLNCLLIGSRRIRKSFAVAMWLLKEAATRAGSEVNIHAPALEQARRDLRYMTDRILESPVLMAYIEKRLGEGIGREHIEFRNRSVVRAKGQAASTDGLGATHMWLEEVDDMNWETMMTRIFPTGSEIRSDYEYGGVPGCRRIATGTIKGKGNIYRLMHPDRESPYGFVTLPIMDAWFGVAAHIIPEQDILLARDVLMTPAQFARTYLALFVESREFFPTESINGCADPLLFPVRPLGGRETYHAAGPVTLGMDFEGRGDSEGGSKTVVVFLEQHEPGTYRWLWGKEWPVGTPPGEVRDQVVEMCKFFRPVRGSGDAYDATFLYDLNRDLYRAGLFRVDVARLENRSGKGGWEDWPIRPIRFEGRATHQMYQRLQARILAGTLRWPVVIDGHDDYRALARFVAQLENVKATQTAAGYDSFETIKRAIGDDFVDAVAVALAIQEEQKASAPAFGGAARMGGFNMQRNFAPKVFRK